MNTSNNAQQLNDEIDFDDLFNDIGLLSSDNETPMAVEEVSPTLVTELDEIDSLFNDLEVEPKVEPKAKPKAEPKVELEVEPKSENLIDELDLDSLEIPTSVAPTITEPKTKAEPKTETKPKAPTTERTTYQNSKKSEVLLSRLDNNASEIVLEFSDADLSPQALAEKQREFLNLLNIQPHMSTTGDSTQKKVAEKVVILFSMFSKKSDRWNEVMRRTFEVLLHDGFITSGDKGNLVQNLLTKPYSIGTARAQAGQMYKMLPLLKIASETEKGKFVLNENSTIVARLRKEYFQDIKVAA